MIVAFDPGATTGWATLDARAPVAFTAGELSGLGALWDFLKGLEKHNVALVIIESFGKAHRVGKFDPSPGEAIGVIRLWCQLQGIEVVEQDPSLKHFWDNKKLKEQDLYIRAKPHACDAMRHLLYFWKFKKQPGE